MICQKYPITWAQQRKDLCCCKCDCKGFQTLTRMLVHVLVTCTQLSLRSKRFQSSYSAKFGAGAKKKWKGEGEGRRGSFTPLPLPLHSFFCSRSSFLDELAQNRLLRRLHPTKFKNKSCFLRSTECLIHGTSVYENRFLSEFD